MERCRENSSTVNRMESHMAGASGVRQQQAEGQVNLERKTRTLGTKLTRRAASCRQREGSHLSLQDLGMLQSICSCDVGRWAAERASSPALWQNRAWKSQELCMELRPGWGPSV